jgi:multiple antibiotic resistance protein
MDLKTFWLCFVPLFVAVDAIGVLPIFISLTDGCERKQRRSIVTTSIITAAAVGLLFLLVGEIVLRLLGITVADFMIAGGIVLFLISVGDLLNVDKPLRRVVNAESLGPVPIGVPLIAGPAVLTTIMLLAREHGFAPTAIAVVINVGIAGIIFYLSGWIMKLIGSSGSKIISKIASLFLAAIAVMMVRKGLGVFIG